MMSPSPTTARFSNPILSLSTWVWRFRIPILLFFVSRALLLIFNAYVTPVDGITGGTPWLRWDATYYMALAEQGYYASADSHATVAFFPLYSVFIRLIAPLVGIRAGTLIISNVALFGAFIMMQLLAEREGLRRSEQTWAIVYLFLYPLGFFLSAGYAESLFLLFTMGCAYAARTHRWTWAICLGMLATLTRITGVLMFGVLVLEWAAMHSVTLSNIHKKETWAALRQGWRTNGWVMVGALGIPLTLLSFMIYMGIYFGSIFAFIDAHHSVRGASSLMRPIEDVIRVITLQTARFDIISGFGALGMVLVLLPRVFRGRASYGWYFLLSAIIPLSTGLISYMRLIGGVFPLYLALGKTKQSPLVFALVNGGMLIIQLLALNLFFTGKFVA